MPFSDVLAAVGDGLSSFLRFDSSRRLFVQRNRGRQDSKIGIKGQQQIITTGSRYEMESGDTGVVNGKEETKEETPDKPTDL